MIGIHFIYVYLRHLVTFLLYFWLSWNMGLFANISEQVLAVHVFFSLVSLHFSSGTIAWRRKCILHICISNFLYIFLLPLMFLYFMTSSETLLLAIPASYGQFPSFYELNELFLSSYHSVWLVYFPTRFLLIGQDQSAAYSNILHFSHKLEIVLFKLRLIIMFQFVTVTS